MCEIVNDHICIHVVFFCTRLKYSYNHLSESTATPPHGNIPGQRPLFSAVGNPPGEDRPGQRDPKRRLTVLKMGSWPRHAAE